MTGSRETGTYLDRILAETVRTVAAAKQLISPEEMAERAALASPGIHAFDALAGDDVAIIAEFKRASPSRGRFAFDGRPEDVAAEYIDGGVRGISCLTDEPFFQGTLADLDAVVAVAQPAGVPVLRKDFMIDLYQIDEARVHGASLVLLIAACLTDDELFSFRQRANAQGMTALVEVHDEDEARRAIDCGAKLIGVNNRNLKTFEVDLGTTERIAPMLPDDVTIVAESGIFTREHVKRMAAAGAHAVLIGESLIIQPDRADAVQKLTGVPRG